jgi:acyl carrier protein
VPGRSVSKWGAFLDDFAGFDSEFFGINEREAIALDRLRRSVDPDGPLSEYGVDSLGALELRTRIETETGIRITSTDITTIRGLAEMLCEKLAPAEAA